MTPYPPAPVAHGVLGVVGPAVVAVLGLLAARRRKPGRWRTVLVAAAVMARPPRAATPAPADAG